jgi:hypothetical protein
MFAFYDIKYNNSANMDSHEFDLHGDSEFFDGGNNPDRDNHLQARLAFGAASLVMAAETVFTAIDINIGTNNHLIYGATSVVEAVGSTTLAYIAITSRLPFHKQLRNLRNNLSNR